MSEIQELIASALAPLLTAQGIDLEALEITPAGKRRVIRVLIDSDDGITLDQVASVSHEVSAELDRLDESGKLGQTPYVLEVSSPGVDRALTLPRHWRRNSGRLVKCSMVDGSTLLGRICSTDERSVEIEIDGAPRTVAYEDIKKAHIEIEFNRTDEK
ncbi:ribosome maturation factor RimP [mine drainage metagenome]|uniref:Ribosome maturation factor RimP n=1 Tax=mine drainage metagenome TaxID=410659 RepID=A0A1J5Q489_9ZZZZ